MQALETAITEMEAIQYEVALTNGSSNGALGRITQLVKSVRREAIQFATALKEARAIQAQYSVVF